MKFLNESYLNSPNLIGLSNTFKSQTLLPNSIFAAELSELSGIYVYSFLFAAYILGFTAPKIYGATRFPNFCFTSDCMDFATEGEIFLSGRKTKSRAIHPCPKGSGFLAGNR